VNLGRKGISDLRRLGDDAVAGPDTGDCAQSSAGRRLRGVRHLVRQAAPRRERLHRHVSLLPDLERGRGHVFPSARSDVRVHFDADVMLHFWGWNLVDWRNAARGRQTASYLDNRLESAACGGRTRASAAGPSGVRETTGVICGRLSTRHIIGGCYTFCCCSEFFLRGSTRAHSAPTGGIPADYSQSRIKALRRSASHAGRTEWKDVLYVMPHACPVCGFDKAVLP
jgi:hypothetical protein